MIGVPRAVQAVAPAQATEARTAARIANLHMAAPVTRVPDEGYVLVIEDSKRHENLVSLLLPEFFPQLAVKLADDGIAGLAMAGLAMAGQFKPRVLIVDILLPGIDGATLTSDTTAIREFLAFKLGAEACGIAILRVLRHDLQGPRRLVETAAHLADYVLVRLPVRLSVLSVPKCRRSARPRRAWHAMAHRLSRISPSRSAASRFWLNFHLPVSETSGISMPMIARSIVSMQSAEAAPGAEPAERPRPSSTPSSNAASWPMAF